MNTASEKKIRFRPAYILVMFFVAIALVGGAFWVFASPFLSAQVTKRLTNEFKRYGASIKIANTELSLDNSWQPLLILQGINIEISEMGTHQLRIDEGAFTLGLSGLLTGNIQIKSIQTENIRLMLDREHIAVDPSLSYDTFVPQSLAFLARSGEDIFNALGTYGQSEFALYDLQIGFQNRPSWGMARMNVLISRENGRADTDSGTLQKAQPANGGELQEGANNRGGSAALQIRLEAHPQPAGAQITYLQEFFPAGETRIDIHAQNIDLGEFIDLGEHRNHNFMMAALHTEFDLKKNLRSVEAHLHITGRNSLLPIAEKDDLRTIAGNISAEPAMPPGDSDHLAPLRRPKFDAPRPISLSDYLQFDEITLALAWQNTQNLVRLSGALLRQGDIIIPFSGHLGSSAEGGNGAIDWHYHLTSAKPQTSASNTPILHPPFGAIPWQGLTARGTISKNLQHFVLTEMMIDLEETRLRLSGRVNRQQPDWRGQLDLYGANLQLKHLQHLSVFLTQAEHKQARDFLQKQVEAADIPNLELNYGFSWSPDWEAPSFRTENYLFAMQFEKTAFLIKELELAISELSGDIKADGRGMTASFNSGRWHLSNDQFVNIHDGQAILSVANANEIVTGEVRLDLSADTDALQYMTSLALPSPGQPNADWAKNMNIEAITGKIDGTLLWQIGSQQSSRMHQQGQPTHSGADSIFYDHLNFKGQATDLTLPLSIGTAQLSPANYEILFDQGILNLSGQPLLFGKPAKLSLRNPIIINDVPDAQGTPGHDAAASPNFQMGFDMAFNADISDLRSLGVDLTNYMVGDTEITVGWSPAGWNIVADLDKTQLSFDPLGVFKPKGADLTAEFTLKQNSDYNIAEISALHLSGSGLEISGMAKLDESGHLHYLELDRFTLMPGDDGRLAIKAREDGGFDIHSHHSRLDGRNIIKSLRDGPDFHGDQLQNIQLSAQIDRLIGFGDVSADNVDITVIRDSKRLQLAHAIGSLGENAPFDVSISRGNGEYLIKGEFIDTGEILRFFDYFSRLSGGAGRFVLTVPFMSAANTATGEEANQQISEWAGSLRVLDFEISQDPAIGELLKRADQEGLTGEIGLATAAEDILTPSNVAFDRLTVRLQKEDALIEITEGLLQGKLLGGTFSGHFNPDGQLLDIEGAYFPIYLLNSFLSKIPLVGTLLAGGSGEGLFGINYRLRGPIANAELTINPASIVVPGVFRKLLP